MRRINAGKVVLQVYGDNESASLAMAEQIIEYHEDISCSGCYTNLLRGVYSGIDYRLIA